MELACQKGGKMKIVVTCDSYKQFNELKEYADAFILSNIHFSTRFKRSISFNIINKILIEKKDIEIFLNVIPFFTDLDYQMLLKNLKKINLELVDGFIIGDLGTYEVFNKLGLANKIIYDSSTLLTNKFDFNMYTNLNIKGAFVSKEINLDGIIEICEYKTYPVFMFGFGHMNLFTSRRNLVTNYTLEYGINLKKIKNNHQYYLVEENRDNKKFPILEDNYGTHVFKDKIFECLTVLDKLKKIDYIIVDNLFIKNAFYKEALIQFSYKKQLNNTSDFIKNNQNIFDNNHLYLKTIYKTR